MPAIEYDTNGLGDNYLGTVLGGTLALLEAVEGRYAGAGFAAAPIAVKTVYLPAAEGMGTGTAIGRMGEHPCAGCLI